MENVLPKYKRPIKGINEPTVNVDFWNEAIDAFDEKEYRKAAIATINYINPNLLKNINTDKNHQRCFFNKSTFFKNNSKNQ